MLGADDQVDVGHALDNIFSFLLGDAAGNTDLHLRVCRLVFSQRAEQAEYFLFGLGPN